MFNNIGTAAPAAQTHVPISPLATPSDRMTEQMNKLLIENDQMKTTIALQNRQILELTSLLAEKGKKIQALEETRARYLELLRKRALEGASTTPQSSTPTLASVPPSMGCGPYPIPSSSPSASGKAPGEDDEAPQVQQRLQPAPVGALLASAAGAAAKPAPSPSPVVYRPVAPTISIEKPLDWGQFPDRNEKLAVSICQVWEQISDYLPNIKDEVNANFPSYGVPPVEKARLFIKKMIEQKITKAELTVAMTRANVPIYIGYIQ